MDELEGNGRDGMDGSLHYISMNHSLVFTDYTLF